jgi:formate C-acetyltransferase
MVSLPDSQSETRRRLARLREEILAGDNSACFVGRERLLRSIPADSAYPETLRHVLAGLSTPVETDDVFLGRMVEGHLSEEERHQTAAGLECHGHICLDWEALLTRGLASIVAEAKGRARTLGDERSRQFAEQAETCATAVIAFAHRYADAARQEAENATGERQLELLRASGALDCSPEYPATDFLTALQAVWLVHMVTSCVIGSRDFALGRMDRWLAPFYERDVRNGWLDRDQAVRLLAHFFMKTNQITGTATDNYRPKPIPCHASKQYVVIGGIDEEGDAICDEMGGIILDAARLVQLPQPTINVRLHPAMAAGLRRESCAATAELGSQIQFVNDETIIPALVDLGIPTREARDYCLTACARIALGGRMDWGSRDHFHNVPAWMLDGLGRAADAECADFDAILGHCRDVFAERMAEQCAWAEGILAPRPGVFHFESLLLEGCVEQCRDYAEGGVRYRPQNHYWGGIATVANSLVAAKRLVCEERSTTLRELLDLAANDFREAEDLRARIRQFPTYGNDDPEVDGIAQTVARYLVDITRDLREGRDSLLLTGFYSLSLHQRFGQDLPGTPDGRRSGEPISENQSPVYGTDRQGPTALLKSVTRLPFAESPLGGLNLTFARPIPPADLEALLTTYCALGGQLVGFSFVTRETLEEAQRHPEQHRSLCVRVFGFSEYFVSLSPAAQEELIARTRL